ncbi:MAG: phosphoribosylanthranilate isomerase [Nitrococcus sp.]|nr:phosphoribosylanthranilate isomerase [Nitrococcus sp.]
MRTRIKICGLTRPDDALAAAQLGVDAVGLVFYERSPRRLSPHAACDIVAALPPFVTVVGLFLDAPAAMVEEVLARVALDLLQFHGAEGHAYCARYHRPYIKALPMGAGIDPVTYARAYPDAAGFLLDSNRIGQAGGSGRTFNWELVPRALGRPIVLAGGLHPGNVAQAILATRPWAVDVSSGVEAAPGVKDPELMSAFVREVARVQGCYVG